MHNSYPYIITISSEKGGVGKTTLASNLAIYLKAMRDDLPITIFSFDNHFTIDKMLELSGQKKKGTIHELLLGAKAPELVLTGQYGVNYIPSSNELGDIHERFEGPMALARILAESGLGGIIVIDTRPDLNILTQNALYAADRVLIPVKDMASLENCRNIFALFDQRGIDRKSLALLPCLIDSRIKFDGVFKDQKTLLRAFAANRGYRCMDMFISKSPKVESLNTNPDGKIYPILTYARGTEVHGQFAEIARDVIREFDHTPESRSQLYAQWLAEKEGKRKESYLARLEGLASRCIICGISLKEEEANRGFYYETSDRSARGFLHTDCYSDMLCTALYGLNRESQAYGAARMVVADKAGTSVSLFAPRESGGRFFLDFRQFSLTGEEKFYRNVQLDGFMGGEFNGLYDRLMMFLNETLSGYGGAVREGCWLGVYPVDPQAPEQVLHDEKYRMVRNLQKILGEAALSPHKE